MNVSVLSGGDRGVPRLSGDFAFAHFEVLTEHQNLLVIESRFAHLSFTIAIVAFPCFNPFGVQSNARLGETVNLRLCDCLLPQQALLVQKERFIDGTFSVLVYENVERYNAAR